MLASYIQKFLTFFTIGLSLARFWRDFGISGGGGVEPPSVRHCACARFRSELRAAACTVHHQFVGPVHSLTARYSVCFQSVVIAEQSVSPTCSSPPAPCQTCSTPPGTFSWSVVCKYFWTLEDKRYLRNHSSMWIFYTCKYHFFFSNFILNH